MRSLLTFGRSLSSLSRKRAAPESEAQPLLCSENTVAPGPEITRSSALERLPEELLWAIVGLLSADDLNSFALCSHRLYLVYGTTQPLLCSADSKAEEHVLLHQDPAASNPEITRSTALERLPERLLWSIADFLSADDLTCFALCSRRLYSSICETTRYQFILPALGEDRLSLLNRLGRDMPTYFVCYTCYCLHKYDGFKLSGYSGATSHLQCYNMSDWPAALEMQLQHFIRRRVNYNIHFIHVQLAMRRFRYGQQCGISTECLAYKQIRPHSLDGTWLFSADAAICPEPLGLCLRFQDILLVRGCRFDLLFRGSKAAQWHDPPNLWYMCKHTGRKEVASIVNSAVQAYQNGRRGPDSPAQSALTCACCGMESLLEVRKSGAKVALILTRWVNLGPGLSPDDLRWKVHCASREEDQVALDTDDLEISSRACFERASLQSLPDLMSRNLSYMEGGRYKSFMRKDPSDYRGDVYFIAN